LGRWKASQKNDWFACLRPSNSDCFQLSQLSPNHFDDDTILDASESFSSRFTFLSVHFFVQIRFVKTSLTAIRTLSVWWWIKHTKEFKTLKSFVQLHKAVQRFFFSSPFTLFRFFNGEFGLYVYCNDFNDFAFRPDWSCWAWGEVKSELKNGGSWKRWF
jgi:hypothetical protein